MKKTFTLCIILLLGISGLDAQNIAGGCDGIRYIGDPFTEVSVTTVDFGANFDAAGQFQTLQMDIYEPVGDTVSQRPVILWAFGGGFIGGDRGDMEETCLEFARRGFVTAAFDYRLYSFDAGLPDSLTTMDMIVKAMHDMKAAVRFFRQDAATDDLYRIDPERILAGGISAGAITSLHTAYLDADDDIPTYFMDILEDNGGLEGSSGDAQNLQYDSDVQFVINLSGALYTSDWIDADEAPLLSIHGTEDEIVPYGHGFLSINFGVTFNFNSVDGTGVLHAVMDDLNMNNYEVAVPGGLHESTYSDPAYESYRTEFTEEGALMIYDFLCPDVPIVVISDTKEIVAAADIALYPNPASDYVHLEVSPNAGIYDVRAYDMLGREVSTWSGLQGVQMLPVDDLPGGTYLLRLRGEGWEQSEMLLIE